MFEISIFDGNDQMEEMVKLNCSVFIGPDYTTDDYNQVMETIQKHVTYPGFYGVKALDKAGKLVGFSYGYESTPGQFYRRKLEGQLSKEQTEEWLADCFEFVELAVAPAARRNGIGGKLHDKLMEDLPNSTTVLTTGMKNAPAISLYEKKGWKVIKRDAPVLFETNLQLIMGKKIK
ncbi:GNAT family N-acetyltransferase [Virgibacillus siamensis]|uniref:GNAT family N-acetyltransferase n=1 Tax=Virgibacillus siamensis TaxID=480071 RepID=UPI0009841AE5|nr:GNAT family N-acetyltransferase [Virgibacillus siamensis]